MKLLITMKLSDRSVLNHIHPITTLENIERIFLVRDTSGSDIEKVKYIVPSYQRKFSYYIQIPIKLFHLIRLSIIEKPALIHSYLLFPHGYLAFLAGKLTGRKVGVSLLAGPVETYVLGGSPIGKYSYCHPLPKQTILGHLILSILKRFDVITVTGTFTKNYLISKGFEEKKIFILPHFVDDRFQPLHVNKEYDVIFVGRLTQVKHVETLIHAIALVKETLPSIRVAIVGEGEERSYLERLTHSLDLSDQFDFVGFQTNTWEWYNRSKISVITSEREGFPYTVMESLKCGVPVIISNCGDVSDIVINNYNGLRIDGFQDVDSYANSITGLLQDAEKIKIYSKNATMVKYEVSIENCSSKWESILQFVVSEP